MHVSVCLSRTLHTASCPRVTHKPFRPTLFPSSAPLHASYTFTSPAHVRTHTRTLLLIYSHTQKTSRTHFLSLRLQLAHLHPPPISRPLGVLPVLLFEGDCCFLGGCGGESSSLKGRDRHTHSHEKKLRERSVMCQSHFCIVRTAISHFKKYMSQHVESCCTERITTKGKETYTEPD